MFFTQTDQLLSFAPFIEQDFIKQAVTHHFVFYACSVKTSNLLTGLLVAIYYQRTSVDIYRAYTSVTTHCPLHLRAGKPESLPALLTTL
jgi:hypothetical protein